VIHAPVSLRPLAILALTVPGVIAACQSTTTPSGGLGSNGLPAETIEVPSSVGPPPSPSQLDDTTPVVLDETLLDVLPDVVGGSEITEAPDEAAIALSAPALRSVAMALDAGVAVDIVRGNLVYALVVRLKPGTFGDAIFRQWRDSFTLGACAASGGPIGEAEATIDGRTVYITSCTGGLRTYHVWLREQDVVISASSIGEARFGEQLMDNLRVPA
jgi:hypothetical protein